MKTLTALLAAFALACARSCTPTPAPAPVRRHPVPRAALARDTSGERYQQEQQRLAAQWRWDGGN